jgi:hypothetical protein
MKKSEKFNFIIILLSIPLIIYLVLFSNDRRSQFKQLESEGILDTAVIVREFTVAKRRLYFEYIFYVDENKYNGFLQYSPSNGAVKVGDSCLVKYLKDDPNEINKLIMNADYKLMKIQ